jgi:predicted transcriptional regulator
MTGLTNKEVATSLGISEQTVKNHIAAVCRELGATGAIEAAWMLGWVTVPDASAHEHHPVCGECGAELAEALP